MGQVALGPITLPTLKGDITETLGDQLETVGAGVVAGERRPRALALRIPIRGSYLDSNRRDAGLRLRRQVRALLDNPTAKLQGLYLDWSVDPEQNGWLLIGGADLKYAQGGITFADFELELTDCYRVATATTHRPARRLVTLDRRLITTPRDILGTVYSIDFAGSTATARHYLGVAITDPVGSAPRVPVAVGVVVSRDGSLYWVTGQPDGAVIDFEQAGGDLHKAIVRLYDDHATTTESVWEPVYGPAQPLTGAPVLDNAVCRVVPASTAGQLDVQSWTGSAWSMDATITHPGGATGFRSRVVEWTTDRAVIAITSTLSAGVRGEMYITLQRGWTGPRVELYATNSAGSATTASIDIYARSSGDATYQRSNTGATAIVNNVSIGTFAGLDPWVALVGPGTDRAVHLAAVQEATVLSGLSIGREGLRFSGARYASVQVGLGARASAATDASTFGALSLIDARAVPELVARG